MGGQQQEHLNNWQHEVLDQLERTAAELGAEITSTETKLDSEDEHYVLVVVESSGQRHDVFVYGDELGIDSAGEWYMFEHQAFDEQNQLRAAAMEALIQLIGGNSTRARELAGWQITVGRPR